MAVRTYAEVPRKEDRESLESVIRTIFADRPGDWFVSVVEPQNAADWQVRVEGPSNYIWSQAFSGTNQRDPQYIADAIRSSLNGEARMLILSISIAGFGPFESADVRLGRLNILVGANGSGKSSFFDFLRAIRDLTRSEVPPEIIPGWDTREVYHRPGPDRLGWRINLGSNETRYFFAADIVGPPGNPIVTTEVIAAQDVGSALTVARLERNRDAGYLIDEDSSDGTEIRNQRLNQLALRSYVSPAQQRLHRLREHIEQWFFVSAMRLNDQKLRHAARAEDSPQLREDGSNLASVLHWLQSEHRPLFNEIETHIRGVIPAFRALAVRPSGAGRVTLQWLEEGLVNPLTAADLSDGTLRLLFWLTLAIVPNPPALVCIDEPEVGLHPRTLPKIAALLKKMSDRAQVIVATHSSYLLAQFDVGDITVLRKKGGSIEFVKPADSNALLESLHEFGADEIELMHRSDELEALS